jgi:SAM-dependent methyltransferase
MSFDDHFSAFAATYARHRPSYPDELYTVLASLAPSRERAVDCGAGNGQAAIGLARHFDEVIAVEPSRAQVDAAISHERVRYVVANAERLPADDASVDLVACAQSVHWFDLETFFADVRRVARTNAVIAVWSYNLTQIEPTIDDVIARYYRCTLRGHWSSKIAYVDDHYRSLPFPFVEIEAPEVCIRSMLTLEEMLGYLASWSATRAYVETSGVDPLIALGDALAPRWGDGAREVRWPLHLRIGRITG